MPSVLRLGGFRVTIYPNDHPPPHVHVIGSGGEAVFNLNCPDGPVELREKYRLTASDIRHIATGLRDNLVDLCTAWGAILGHT